MTIFDHKINSLAGELVDLRDFSGKTLLVVNVASQCGFTPQYGPLQEVYERYRDRGFAVLGFPCNQFGAQEPGSAAEISEFCETNYGVTFPLFEKIDVNGPGQHPIYAELVDFPDDGGIAGDVQWNFEKFLIGPDGTIVRRFRSNVSPDDKTVIRAIEGQLKKQS